MLQGVIECPVPIQHLAVIEALPSTWAGLSNLI